MRVKCFEFSGDSAIEKEINKWLEENGGIEIVNITQSESSYEVLTVIIWYKTT